ncbi:energy transducer TonB [Wenzhouxiangella limi]|uniref:Protein TonB n=1 Tax=Wenzhouxiangella limi TaxID=2707351 RepID=A0A845V085_9GAMM|nr:energy transducer TonB [Wenzhouxiangella limi]NDY95942.1 energy transducer TonB [Wenzhouxiangella limi]
MTAVGSNLRGTDSLAMALALAVGLHVAVIGLVHFDFETFRAERELPSLDVVLVDWATEEVPEEADLLAQVSQSGGGESPETGRPPEPTPATEPAPEPNIPQPIAEAGQSNPLPEELIAVDESSDPLLLEKEPSERLEADAPDPRELVEQSMAMARLNPERSRQSEDFRQQPRRKFISASTREHLYASYMSAWISKVERIGNMNYPEAARRQNIEGSLVLSVDILPDGGIDQVRVLRSSGHAVLDEAAVKIVRLSAPFAALPEEITDQVDILTITRTWQFSSSGGLIQG